MTNDRNDFIEKHNEEKRAAQKEWNDFVRKAMSERSEKTNIASEKPKAYWSDSLGKYVTIPENDPC